MNTTRLSDRAMTEDLLSTQKFITGGYNTNANEASEISVKNTMMSILEDEHAIGHDVFVEMHSRGWYQTENAPQDKINQTKQTFSDCCTCC